MHGIARCCTSCTDVQPSASPSPEARDAAAVANLIDAAPHARNTLCQPKIVERPCEFSYLTAQAEPPKTMVHCANLFLEMTALFKPLR